ncbi:MAG: hypothetical protein KGD65_14905 [Candidatus Lokiarchaeota archaeon]|nr:hypothetical protein [Candidatus Lokiarchaeota archaeon]
MNDKYSLKTQNEINSILERLNEWKNLFFFEVKYFYEGWAIYMREKNTYPRSLVIFKSSSDDYFSIKSFEIHFSEKNETYKELYINEKIDTIQQLFSEVKEIIYGKDILNSISKFNYEPI